MAAQAAGESLFNVRDARYGARGDGIADDGPAIQRAVDAALAGGGGTVYLPAGRYRIATPVVADPVAGTSGWGRLAVHGAGVQVTVVIADVAPAINFGRRAGARRGQVDGLALRELTVQAGRNLGYARGMLRFSDARFLTIERIQVVGGPGAGNEYAACGIELDTSYLATLVGCESLGRKVCFAEIHSAAHPLEQMDTITFVGCVFVSTYGVIIRSSTGDNHNIVFQTCKHVLVTGADAEGGYDVATRIARRTSAGDRTLPVTSATGLAPGAPLIVGAGGDVEVVEIASVAGTVVTLAPHTPLRFAHAEKASVLRGGIGIAVAPNTYNVVFRELHIEGSAAGILASGGRRMTIENVFSGSNDVLRIAGSGVQELSIRGGVFKGTERANNVVNILDVGDGPDNARWVIEGPSASENPRPLQAVTPRSPDRQWWSLAETNGDGYLTDTRRYPAGTDQIVDEVWNGPSIVRRFTTTGHHAVGGDYDARGGYRVNGTRVVGARATGWEEPRVRPDRSAFGGSVTTAELARRVAALIADLRGHGLIG